MDGFPHRCSAAGRKISCCPAFLCRVPRHSLPPAGVLCLSSTFFFVCSRPRSSVDRRPAACCSEYLSQLMLFFFGSSKGARCSLDHGGPGRDPRCSHAVKIDRGWHSSRAQNENS
ncbi:unnamed protein product [Hapterophycus canaliculatus]